MALEAVKESVTNEILSLGKCDQLLDVTEGVTSCQTLPKVWPVARCYRRCNQLLDVTEGVTSCQMLRKVW
jgi:hypothetical protein